MTTGTTVTTSSSLTGITWKASLGASKDSPRIKLTVDGVSREVNANSQPTSDGALRDPVIKAIRDEVALNGVVNTVMTGTVTLSAASTKSYLLTDTDFPGF